MPGNVLAHSRAREREGYDMVSASLVFARPWSGFVAHAGAANNHAMS